MNYLTPSRNPRTRTPQRYTIKHSEKAKHVRMVPSNVQNTWRPSTIPESLALAASQQSGQASSVQTYSPATAGQIWWHKYDRSRTPDPPILRFHGQSERAHCHTSFENNNLVIRLEPVQKSCKIYNKL